MTDFGDDFVKRLQIAVSNVKASREMEAKFMLFEELIKEEREDARADGINEGLINGRVESILDLLEEFGNIPDELRVTIQSEKNPDVLKSYLKKASIAQSIEEFKKLIKE